MIRKGYRQFVSGLFFLLFMNAVCFAQKANYKEQANIVYNNIYKHFYDSTRGLFKERTVLKKEDKPYSFLWPLCALIQAADGMEAMNPGQQYMKPVVQAINKYYNDSLPPRPGYDSYVREFGGGDRFYDDNQWIAIAYMDAYNRTTNKEYIKLAREIYDFMLSGYDTAAGGGMYWKEFDHTTKNTCSNGPGVLVALQLYKATMNKSYLDTALLIYNWTKKNLQAPDKLYWDNIKIPSGKIDEHKYTYNTGTMLQSAVLLYNITNDKKYLEEAKAVAESSHQFFFRNNKFPDHYWFNAVLLRGYVELYKVDHDKKYIDAFKEYVSAVWEKERDNDNLIGKEKEKSLIDQAAYLEMLTTLQRF